MSEAKFIQATNKERDMQAILDSYASVIKHQFYMAEALQKDAIQNSWDARIDKNQGKNWKCEFKLINVLKNTFLTITDEGTKGLIGTKFDTQDQLMNILRNEDENEDLATFCSSNWSRKTGKDGGNRGRGKVVFLGSSKNQKIYFDSYRSSDNKYVMVELYISENKEIEYGMLWDKEAKTKLAEISANKLPPLETHGTRIIIVNPDSKIVDAIKHGQFLSYISNTWWEIIKKYDAKIIINDGIIKNQAKCPVWYNEDLEDLKINNIVIKNLREDISRNESISLKDTSLKVKSIVLRYCPDRDIPMGLKGIAIQRGGMTIERCKTEDMVREQGMSNVYGWVELNEELSQGMKECEGPEHCDFIWSKNPACHLNKYLKNKSRGFAKDLELIEDEYVKKNKIQKQASQKATKFLLPLFKKLNLITRGGNSKKPRNGETRQANERLRLSCTDFKLPNETIRVNYDEEVKGAYVLAINEYDRDFFVQVKVWVESENGLEIIIEEKEFNLSNKEKIKIGCDTFLINQDFEKGNYNFKARMLLLEDADTNIQIGKNLVKAEKSTILYDRINKKFCVEIEPPETGPFDFQPYISDDKNLLVWGDYNDVDNTLIFYYNTAHPKLIPLIENKEDSEPLSEYLIGQGIMLMYQMKIDSMLADEEILLKEEDEELKQIIASKSLEKVFPYLLQKQSELLWEYLSQ